MMGKQGNSRREGGRSLQEKYGRADGLSNIPGAGIKKALSFAVELLPLITVPVLIFVGYRLSLGFLRFMISPADFALFEKLMGRSEYELRIELSVAIFFFVSVINLVICHLLEKEKQSLLGLFIPFIIIASISEDNNIFTAALLLTLSLFGAKITLTLIPASESRKRDVLPPKSKFFGREIFQSAVIALPLALLLFSEKPVLVVFYGLLLLIAFFACHGDRRRFLGFEFKLSLVQIGIFILDLTLASLLPLTSELWPLILFLSGAIPHYWIFRMSRQKLLWYNVSMLAMIMIVGLSFERFFASPAGGVAGSGPRGVLVGGKPNAGSAGDQERDFRDAVIIGKTFFEQLFQGAKFVGKFPDRKKSENTFRIFALGTSTTAGFDYESPQNLWPSILERDLDRRGLPYRVEVFNAGLPGVTSGALLEMLRLNLVEFHPDMVILFLAANDQLHRNYLLTDKQMIETFLKERSEAEGAKSGAVKIGKPRAINPARGLRGAVVEWLTGNSVIFRWLYENLNDFQRLKHDFSPEKIIQAVPEEDFLQNLEDFYELSETHGFKLVMAGEANFIDLTRYKTLMSDMARTHGFPYFDANDHLSECGGAVDDLFLDGSHLTNLGHQCIGRMISEFLLGSNVMPKE